MTKPYRYKPKKEIDYFERLERENSKPKIKFKDVSQEENKPEVKVIKKKNIETPYVRQRREELNMIKNTLEYLQVNRDYKYETKKESIIQSRRKEILQIKELLIAEVKASSRLF